MKNKFIGLIVVAVVIGLVVVGVVFMGGENKQESEQTSPQEDEQQSAQANKKGETDPNWKITTVKEGIPYMNDFNAVMDSEDNIHLIYQDTESHNVMHMYREGSDWKKEIITEMDVGAGDAYPDIVVQDESLHAAFYTGEGVVYAQKKNDKWETELIDSDGYNGTKISLVMRNTPHVLYSRMGDALSENPIDTVYANKAEGEWKQEVIKSELISKASLTLDKNNTAHISYVDDDKIYHDSLKDNQWNFEQVDKEISGNDSVILFEEGTLKLIYSKSIKTETYPRVASLEDGTWSIEKVNTKEASGGNGISAAFNKQENPCAVYSYSVWNYDANESWAELIFIKRSNDQWGQTVIKKTAKQKEEEAEDITNPSLKFDSNGKAHIIYVLEVKEDGETTYNWEYAREK